MIKFFKKIVRSILDKIFFNYYNPHYFPTLYMLAKRYVLFYQGDENRDRNTNGGWRFLREFSKTNPKVVLDVGAHHGAYVLKLNKLCPSVKIYAFEPTRATYNSLVKKVKDKNIIVINSALGSSEGTVTLYTNPMSDSINSVYKMDNQNFKHTESEQVKCTTVDLFCNQNKINHIDMLKIDVEGHDFNVIKGAREMISSKKIDIIQFEFSMFNTYSNIYLYDFYKFFEPFEYELFKIKPLGLEEVPFPEYERTTYAYFVAIKKGSNIDMKNFIGYKLGLPIKIN